MSTYAALLNEHATLPSITPAIPSTLLQPLAILFLTTAFILSFGFSTLRSKGVPTTELAVGGAASLFGGFGVVFAFCAAGLNV